MSDSGVVMLIFVVVKRSDQNFEISNGEFFAHKPAPGISYKFHARRASIAYKFDYFVNTI